MIYRRCIILSLIAVVLLLLSSLIKAPTSALAANECKEVYSIFARGSGEDLLDREAKRFADQLDLRLADIPHETAELGDSPHLDKRYPAVNVSNTLNGNALGAFFSGGYSNDYGKSVFEGEQELFRRLVDIHSTCPDSRIILGGYSQGAQLIGQALNPIDTQSDIEDQIEFVALFGDPKLNLPEGRGFNPPACREEQRSPWRRTVPNCDTDNGSLGARDPYIPSSMEDKVGLWCNDNDFVCGSTKNPFMTSGHGEYAKDNGAIDQAVHEIAERLQEKLALKDVSLVPDMFKIPLGHPDVMIVLENSNENMPAWYDFVIPTTFAIADQVTEQGGRVGLQTFNGCAKKGRIYNTPLSNNPGLLEDTARSAWHMRPECDLSQDLIKTLEQIKNSSGWKANRNKIVIVIPKVPFSIPGIATSSILSNQPDLHLYSIEPESADGSYGNLRVGSYKNTSIKLSDFNAILAENTTNPQVVARLRNPNIEARPGDVIEFSASNSFVYDDTIDHYDWDFDGNGTIDQTTTGPKVNHTYTSPFNGRMSVTVVTTSGISDNVALNVLIQPESMFKRPAKAPINLKLTKLSDSSVRFSWEPGDNSAIGWLIRVDDFPTGYTKKDQLYATITDIPLKESHTLSVEAIVDDDTGGEVATISTDSLNPSARALSPTQEQKNKQASDRERMAAEILGKAAQNNQAEYTNPAARAVAKLNPATKSIIRSSLIFIVAASLVAAGVLGWLLYKRRKTLFNR